MDIWDQILRWGNWIGIPAVTTWWLYDRRKIRNQGRVGEAEADVAALTVKDKAKSSSIVTLEAELLAAQRSFDADRAVKDSTILWLQHQLEEARAEDERKETVIDKLQAQVRSMQARMDQMSRELTQLQKDLESARGTGTN